MKPSALTWLMDALKSFSRTPSSSPPAPNAPVLRPEDNRPDEEESDSRQKRKRQERAERTVRETVRKRGVEEELRAEARVSLT